MHVRCCSLSPEVHQPPHEARKPGVIPASLMPVDIILVIIMAICVVVASLAVTILIPHLDHWNAV